MESPTSPNFTPLPRATALAHRIIREHLKTGGRAVDATVGNGHDTLFLAKIVGESGQVFGFDIQAAAIESATEKLTESGKQNVSLFHAGHEEISKHVEGRIDVAMFNLGYLPGGDKSKITRAESTRQALQQCCFDLEAAAVTVVVYSGHDGGREEAEAIVNWASDLDQEVFSVIQYGFINQRNRPPFLIAIERKR